LARAFVRHRGLIAFAAGGAMAETTLLSFLAPSARPLAPQVTALPPLAAYHDLRWLFAFNQPWLGFTGVLVLLILARSAVDAAMVMLAWPHEPARPRPRFLGSLVSCAVLTVLVGLVMSPVVTLMFGVALLPFSWPYLAAVPILVGTAIALSQGGVGQFWWRRLPPARTAGWVIITFGTLSLASALMTHLDTPGIVAVAGLAGIVDARAWYGLTAAAAMARGYGGRVAPHEQGGAGGDRPPWQRWVPMAPLAAVLVLVLVVGVARLAFTGTVRFDPDELAIASIPKTPKAVSAPASKPRGAVLVVDGFGSSCCHSADALRAAEPHLLVRQFSYHGLTSAGQPVPYGRAGNLSLQVLGDRLAAQVEALSRQAGPPVAIVAESEGTLGVYAMLARHPHVPISSVTLLSPIVEPGQFGQAGETVPGAALTTLNNLIGGMSPYGSSGAGALIDSVSEVGASYFAEVSHDHGLPWMAVVPLADAVTLPACPWPKNVIFVDALHGGLLGDGSVQSIVETFLATGAPPDQDLDVLAGGSQRDLRSAARLIAGAGAAWRMPELDSACPA
jgi:hypothetical protein